MGEGREKGHDIRQKRCDRQIAHRVFTEPGPRRVKTPTSPRAPAAAPVASGASLAAVPSVLPFRARLPLRPPQSPSETPALRPPCGLAGGYHINC